MASNVQPTTLTGSDQLIVTSTLATYYGFSIRETAASTAVVRVYAGITNGGKLIDTIGLAASGNVAAWYGPQGIAARDGIYVDIVSGTVEGVLYAG